MDAALRDQLKTLSQATRAQSQKGQGVGQEFLAIQKAGYDCENLCRDANYGIADAVLDTFDTDNSGGGKALKAALGGIGAAQGAVTGKCGPATADAATWVADVSTLRAQYAAIIAAVGAGPVAEAVGQGMALLDSAAALGKSIKFSPAVDLSRFGVALQIASGGADEVSGDLSPAKGGKNVSFAARRASSYLNEMNGLVAGVSQGAQNAGLTQNQASQLCWQAAVSLDRVIYPGKSEFEMPPSAEDGTFQTSFGAVE